MTQLQQLAKPFPDHMIHANPGAGNRGSYVKHSAVRQKLLAVVGPYRWAIVDIVRDADTNQVVGCIGALTCSIDGVMVTVHGAGDCENPKNWPHDGARLKDAESDAIKRAAMNVGPGLHLWAQDEYALDKQLAAKGGESVGSAPSQTSVKGHGARPGRRKAMTNRWQFWIAIATVTAITSVADVWTGRTVLAAISAWACGAACVFAVTQAERHG